MDELQRYFYALARMCPKKNVYVNFAELLPTQFHAK